MPLQPSPAPMTRRQVIKRAAVGGLALPLQGLACASTGIETTALVCGFAAGGTADIMCRWVARKLTPGFARAAVTDNRTGAGGQIAISYVKGRPADGTTVLLTPTSMLTIYPHIYKKLPYDAVVDLTPVSLACVFEYGLAVGPAVPSDVKTVKDFVTWAKANPNGANYGSPGAGTTAHFVGTLLGDNAGVRLQHLAYRGGQPAMLDLISGNIASVIAPVGTLNLHTLNGKARILAVASSARSSFAPRVPTFREQGYEGLAHDEWFGFFLPAKAPRELVAQLNAELKAALAAEDVVSGVAEQGLKAMSSSPEQLGRVIADDIAKWGPIVKKIGFSAES